MLTLTLIEVAGDPKGVITTPGNHQRNDLTLQLQMHPNLMDTVTTMDTNMLTAMLG